MHFTLIDSDAYQVGEGWESSDPDVFAWIEVLDQAFLYQMAEVAVDVVANHLLALTKFRIGPFMNRDRPFIRQ